MPWGIAMAGLFPGIILNLMMSGLCLYTAYRLVVAYAYHGKRVFLHETSCNLPMQCHESIVCISEGGGENIEVLELSRIYLGKWAEYIAKIFSIAVLIGATVAYWVLMANFLYNIVNFIYGKDSRCNHMCMRMQILMNPLIMIFVPQIMQLAGRRVPCLKTFPMQKVNV